MDGELHSRCAACMYADCTKENDEICRECHTWDKYTPAPHILREQARNHEDGMDALIEALKRIRNTCKEYYDERIGCSNCPLRGSGDEDICEVGYFNKPSGWKLKCDEKQDNRLFM